MNKLIVNFAPTGMLMKKKDTIHVPISPAEIIEDVRKAVNIGISSVHLHARNEDEIPCWEKEKFRDIILGIREFAPELVISVSTSGRIYNLFEQRANVLFLDEMAKPDMASLTLSSLNFNKTASMNEPDMICRLAKCMQERGIKPELEVFDVGMVNYARYLITKGLLTPPYYFNVILGNIACAQANLLHAGMIVNELPENSFVSFGGIGNYQLPINAMAIAMNYGVRSGIEDNIWFDEGRTVLASNQDYLQRIHKLADSVGRDVCSSVELRKMLGLKPGNGAYGMS